MRSQSHGRLWPLLKLKFGNCWLTSKCCGSSCKNSIPVFNSNSRVFNSNSIFNSTNFNSNSNFNSGIGIGIELQFQFWKWIHPNPATCPHNIPHIQSCYNNEQTTTTEKPKAINYSYIYISHVNMTETVPDISSSMPMHQDLLLVVKWYVDMHCWNTNNWIVRNTLKWVLNCNTTIFIHEQQLKISPAETSKQHCTPRSRTIRISISLELIFIYGISICQIALRFQEMNKVLSVPQHFLLRSGCQRIC